MTKTRWQQSERRAGRRRLQVLLLVVSISLPISIGAGIVAFAAFQSQIDYQERQLIQTQRRRIESRFDTCELLKGVAYHAATGSAGVRLTRYLNSTPLENCPLYARHYDLPFP